MATEKFRPAAGCYFQVLEKDCSGTAITQADVASLKYTVYELGYGGARTPVTGHTNVSCSVASCVLNEPATDPETSKTYNVRVPISAASTPPFPKVGATYEIEIVMTDQNGEPHAEYKHGICDTN